MEAGGGLLEAVMPELGFDVPIEDSFMKAGAAWKSGNSLCV